MDKVKETALQDILEYKKNTINTKNGLDRDKTLIKYFLNTIKSLEDLQEKELVSFFNTASKKYSEGSINIIKNLVKNFIKWYYPDYSVRFRNLDNICKRKKITSRYSPTDMLTKEDVEKLVQAENETYWKAYWLLYFYGGFRPSEVCNLEWGKITFDKDGAYIEVYVKKNNKTFQKFIPEDVVFYLKKLENNNSKYVFPTKRKHKHKISVGDKPLTRSGVYQRLVMLSKKVLGKQINPYVLRHSIATILYDRDDIKDDDAAEQMGHSKSMKQTYSNLSISKKRRRAKKIWINPEDLPPEKKHELLERIDKLEKENKKRGQMIVDIMNSIDKIEKKSKK